MVLFVYLPLFFFTFSCDLIKKKFSFSSQLLIYVIQVNTNSSSINFIKEHDQQ